MTKRFQTRIGERDLEVLTALNRTPLTVTQLQRLSVTFSRAFRNPDNLRRRLRKLAASGLVQSWPYAIASDGRSPRYFRLAREGYRLLYGEDARLPGRRDFEEIGHARHHHTFALAEVIVRLLILAERQGIAVRHFARENSLRISAGEFTLYPDAAFQLVTNDGRALGMLLMEKLGAENQNDGTRRKTP